MRISERVYYKLEGHEVVPVYDLIEWAKTFELSDRRVAATRIGDTAVSTVFLGLDHQWDKSKPPLLFETMIFTRKSEWGGEDMWRYSTWDEAIRGHYAACRHVVDEIAAFQQSIINLVAATALLVWVMAWTW